MPFSRLPLSAAGFFFMVAGPALADPPAPSASEVVVTAVGVPTLAADAPDVVVIDRSEIDALQAVFASDVLSLVPGLAFTQDGAFGGVASVSLWGASSDKTLVVIDGVRQNDPSDPNGAYDFSNLDLADVERIEVLEGPQSSIWGSDAIGGVVAVTTRELDGWRASAEGGSLATFDGSAAAGVHGANWAAGGQVFGDRSDGVAKADGIGPPNPYWDWTASAWGRVTPLSWLSLDGRLRYQSSDAAIDGYNAITGAFGYTPQTSAVQSWTGLLRAEAAGPLGFTDTFSGGFTSLDRTDVYVGQPADSSRYWAVTEDYRLTAERGAATDPWALVLGAERLATSASLSTGVRENLGTTSGFVVARVSPAGPLTLSGSERFDATDTYGSAATGRASAVVRFSRGFALDAAFGQGFKTPTISEIACDFCFPAGPSVGLKPERAEGWDAGASWTSSDRRIDLRVLAYRLSVRDEIAFAAVFPFRYGNIAATRSDGFEARLAARLPLGFSLAGEYAYVDARDLATGTEMLRIPRDSGSAVLSWARGRFSAAVTARAEGDDLDLNPSSFVSETRPGFWLVSADGAYALTPRLQLTARIEDLANVRYEEVLGYGEPRRMILVGFRARS